MISIVILGGGNVAHHLAKKFINTKGIDLIQIYNRSLNNIEEFINKTNITNNIFNLKNADVYIIAVSDNMIEEVSRNLNLANKLVVHTSGAMNISDLKSNSNKGVFYPLQSFSKNSKINFSKVPLCLEAENNEDYKLLKKIAKKINSPFYNITSEKREKLHLAAVFVNNFTNYLYQLGENICDDNNVTFEILKPLIKETSEKIIKFSPRDTQTGPAMRNDTKTIEKHLNLLTKNQQEIYTLLSNSIAKSYGKKL